MHEPIWSRPTANIQRPPVWIEGIVDALDLGLFPLRTPHDVIIVVADNIGLNAATTLDRRVAIRIVCDVADVEHAQRPSVLLRKVFEPVGVIHQRTDCVSRCPSVARRGRERRCRSHRDRPSLPVA